MQEIRPEISLCILGWEFILNQVTNYNLLQILKQEILLGWGDDGEPVSGEIIIGVLKDLRVEQHDLC